MAKAATVAVLSVSHNGQVTIPADFRKDFEVAPGGKLLAVRMGETLVMAPHDAVLESVCLRLQESMKSSGITVDDLKAAALEERASIVQRRYGKAG